MDIGSAVVVAGLVLGSSWQVTSRRRTSERRQFGQMAASVWIDEEPRPPGQLGVWDAPADALLYGVWIDLPTGGTAPVGTFARREDAAIAGNAAQRALRIVVDQVAVTGCRVTLVSWAGGAGP